MSAVRRTGRSALDRQRAHYERTAARFDRSIWSLGNRDNRNHETKARAVAEAIEAARGGQVLEVGAGTGLHARWLLEHTPVSYTGLDLSEPMLTIARERVAAHAGRARLVVGDAARLPFPDASFDAAFCTATLHHLPDARAGIAELVRVVRPGGRVAAVEPNWKFPSVLVMSAITPAEHAVFRLNGPRLVRWAREAGLEEVTLRRLLYTPPAPRSWARLYDAIDRGAGRVPGLRRLSIVLLVSGRVPEGRPGPARRAG
jgi:ubiquinone/menaquinone biosynthesis C-methylase UbiE